MLAGRERSVAVHRDVDERMHVRIAAKVQHRAWSLESKHLSFRNRAVLAALVVAEEQSVDPAIHLQALARIGHVICRIRRQYSFDERARHFLAPSIAMLMNACTCG